MGIKLASLAFNSGKKIDKVFQSFPTYAIAIVGLVILVIIIALIVVCALLCCHNPSPK